MYRKQIEDMEHPKENVSLQRVYSCRFVECTLRWYLKSFLLTGRCCTPFLWSGQLYQRQIGMNKNWWPDKNLVLINNSIKKKTLQFITFQLVQSLHIFLIPMKIWKKENMDFYYGAGRETEVQKGESFWFLTQISIRS